MANNGVLSGGVCVTPSQYSKDLCLSLPGCTISQVNFYVNDGLTYFYTYVNGVWINRGTVSLSCELSVPPLTDVQQIQAVNQILPYALAFLSSIWAMKKIFQVLWNSSISFSSKKEQE